MPRAGTLCCVTTAALVALCAGRAQAWIPAQAESRFPADTAPATATPDSSGAAEFPVSQIPTQAEATSTRLREIEQALRPTREVGQIERGLPGARDTVTAIWDFQREILEKQQSRRLLIDLNQEWTRRETQYTEWRKAVQAQSADLAGLVGEVDSLRRRWTRTLESMSEPDVPSQIAQQVQAALTEVQAETARINQRLDELLIAQFSITKILLDIEQARTEISNQLGVERRELLQVDSPPLWRAAAYSGMQGLTALIGRSIEATVRAVKYFTAVYRNRLIPHVVVTLLLIGVAIASRRKRELAPGSEAAAGTRLVSTHPVASVILASLLATWWIYPHALLPVYDLAILATVLPLLVLMPAYLSPEQRRPATALLGLAVLLRLTVLLLGESPAQRLVLIPLTMLGAGWCIAELRSVSVFRTSWAAWSGLLRLMGRLALAALVISLFANLVGNFSLAGLLTVAVLTSAYLALVLTALVHVFTDVLVLLLSSEATRRSRFVQHHRAKLGTGGSAAVRLAAVFAWAVITMQMFTLFDPISGAIRQFLAAKFTLGMASVSVGGVLIFLLTVWLSVSAGRTVSSILELDVLDRMDLPYGLPSTIGKLVRYTLVALGFFLALAAIGVELTKLTILGGALGVGVGFGLQNIVNNFVSGLILAFERPIREGDVIEVGGLLGTVRRIGARSSTLRTYDGAEVVVPNADLIAKQVVNWTLSDRTRRIVLSLGVAYGSNPNEVIALLVNTALQHPKVLRVPEPGVAFKGFGESSLDFELLMWTAEFEDAGSIKSEVGVAVYEALQKAGIEIPFPQRDLHLRTVDEGAAGALRNEAQIPGSGAD